MSEGLLRTDHYLDTRQYPLKAQSELDQFEYVLALDIIKEMAYEQEVVRQRRNQASDNDTVYTFTFVQTLKGKIESWDGQEQDSELQRTVLQNWLSGNDPDLDIDQQLAQLGIDPNSSCSLKEAEVDDEVRELVDELQSMTNTWQSQNETVKQKFLADVPLIAQRLGVQLSVEYLLPNLKLLVDHKSNSPVQRLQLRGLLLSDFEKLISQLATSEITAGYNSMRDHLLPLYVDYFQEIQADQDYQTVTRQFKRISQTLIYEDRIEKILPLLLDLLKDDSDEEKRVLGLVLLDLLAEDFGTEVCSNYLIYEIVSLQEDPLYRVRKETCKNLVNISKVVDEEVFIGVIVPVFKKLCTDHIWGVRRQAVEVLPEICKLAPDDIKIGALLDIFKKFAKDQSKWVKQAATQFLGPFLISFKGLSEISTLLQFYSAMVNETLDRKSANGTTQAQQDEDDLYHCAFNFPAILFTLGQKAWPQLKEVYFKFVKDRRERIRKTLAYSLHDVAKLIPDASELIPVFDLFTKDVQDIREGVIDNIPTFVQSLQQKEAFVNKISELLTQRCSSWRARIQQAQNLTKICSFLSAQTFEPFLPFYLELCTDEVAEVRIRASLDFHLIMSHFAETDQQRFDNCMELVLSFKESKKYTKRQDFISMCEGAMLNGGHHQGSVFLTKLVKPFCELGADPIVNVRLELSQTIQRIFYLFQNDTWLQQVILRLKTDSSRDVTYPLREITVESLDDQTEQLAEVDPTDESRAMLSEIYDCLCSQ